MISPAPHRVLLTYGIFDDMGPDCSARLRRLGALGRDVIVGCATDTFCRRSGLAVTTPYALRRMRLERTRFVSHVIGQECWDQLRTDIVNYNVDVLALGDVPPGVDLSALRDIVHLVSLPWAAGEAGVEMTRRAS
ncbi:hypothetical protein BOO69_07830 [Sulfitobacter alexandrii]|uniref:Uncharacterized protein n=1 Tax=Sulfitobacter alexandrii TaxID=1917485 RepID=A0A1J0WGS7_9RHOB|nr:hypothetical protein [Sulfitobacter alexandrii]APE43334.1 hypothetical protein BOO69_07830 [Sulfitobacter alexandrii]